MRDENFEQTLAQKIYDAVQDAIPVGKVAAFLRSSPPKGWLALNGQKVYQSVHAELYGYLSGLPKLTKGSDSTGAYVSLPDFDGRVLQGTNDAARVGELLEAQLPNITGEFAQKTGSWTGGFLCEEGHLATGAFKKGVSTTTHGMNFGGATCNALGFNASQADATYSGSTFQPRAGLTLLCIKI